MKSSLYWLVFTMGCLVFAGIQFWFQLLNTSPTQSLLQAVISAIIWGGFFLLANQYLAKRLNRK